jgi:hypothetical protein
VHCNKIFFCPPVRARHCIVHTFKQKRTPLSLSLSLFPQISLHSRSRFVLSFVRNTKFRLSISAQQFFFLFSSCEFAKFSLSRSYTAKYLYMRCTILLCLLIKLHKHSFVTSQMRFCLMKIRFKSYKNSFSTGAHSVFFFSSS